MPPERSSPDVSAPDVSVPDVSSPDVEPRWATLFEPLRCGPVVLPNRFVQVPHANGFGTRRPLSQAAYRGVRAEGGWGTVCVEYSPVSPDSDEWPAVAANLWDDADARALARTVEAIHAHGAVAGVELVHTGAAATNGVSRLPRLAPSAVTADLVWGSLAAELTVDDIRRVQRDWVQAALRARDVGFDLVHVYGAHGYLLSQFLSTATNRRTDGYGGSLEGRARFWLETLEQVRAAVGDDCAIATRIAVHGRDGLPGIELDDMLAAVALADPLVDLFDVTVGSWPENSGTSRYHAEGFEQPWTHRVREATGRPIVAVGRYTSPDVMAAALRSGKVDLIGAARPAIADPFLPNKIRTGRTVEIRECTGSNQCILREEAFAQIGCVQNPTAGEEHRRGWHPETVPPLADPDLSYLVVGAGPSGLECALTLVRRGARAVHVVDADPEPGGHLRWLRRLPTLGDWGRAVDARLAALQRFPAVSLVLGRRLDTREVLDYGADVVVLATGSRWRSDGVQPGTAPTVAGVLDGVAPDEVPRPDVLTPEAVVRGARPPGPGVVVYDADGYVVAVGIAELLRAEGYDVVAVTPHPVLSPLSDATLEGELLRRHLIASGIRGVRGVTATRWDDGHLHGVDADDTAVLVPGDGLVLVTARRPEDALHRRLAADPEALAAAGIRAVHLIGDARAPRLLAEVVFDGHRLAREIERPPGSAPPPYRHREDVPLL